MNNKILQAALAFALLTTIHVTSQACTLPVEAVINNPDPSWYQVGQTVCFDGSDSWGPGGICHWQWDFDDGSPPDGYEGPPPDCDVTDPYSYKVEHAYTTPGAYHPELWVRDCYYDDEDTNSFALYVIDISLTADSTYICRDLVPIHLKIETPKGDDKATLGMGGTLGSIKIWADEDREELILPYNGKYWREWNAGYFTTEKTWYVEGVPAFYLQFASLLFQYFGVPPLGFEQPVPPSPELHFTVGDICTCPPSSHADAYWANFVPSFACPRLWDMYCKFDHVTDPMRDMCGNLIYVSCQYCPIISQIITTGYETDCFCFAKHFS